FPSTTLRIAATISMAQIICEVARPKADNHIEAKGVGVVVYLSAKHSTVRRTVSLASCRYYPPNTLRIVDTMKKYLSMENLRLRRASNPDCAEAGFTLLETLVALVIFPFGILAAGQM